MSDHTPVVARTVKGFCGAYGIGVTTCYKLIAKRLLDVRKAGSRTLITEESAQRWFNSVPVSLPVSIGVVRGEGRRKTAKELRKRQYHKSRVPKGRAANTRTISNRREV